MNSRERILGELTEFRRATVHRLDQIESKIDSFQSFRWKLIGASSLAAFLATIVIEILRK